MTRPIALTIALTFAGPAFAAVSAEPLPSDDTSESAAADKDGKRNTQAARSTSSGAKAGKTQHQLPSGARAGAENHVRSGGGPDRARNAEASKSRQSQGQQGQRPSQPSRADQARANSPAKAAATNPNKQRASQSRADAARTRTPAKAAATHRSATSHQQRAATAKRAAAHKASTAHQRASAAKRATIHKRATSHARSRWARSWSAHRGGYKRPVRWYHGVFVFGPKPVYHNHYQQNHGKGGGVNQKALPNRKVDRNGDFGVALTSGTYLSGYDEGGDFSDFGLGVTARYRPVETVGLELAYSYHDDTFDSTSERTTSLLQPSVNVYAFPWTRVSPYASLGLTWASRNYEDTWSDGLTSNHETVSSTAFGPSLGAGVEFNLGEAAALDLEAKYNGFVNVGAEDPNVPGALQAGAGLTFYF